MDCDDVDICRKFQGNAIIRRNQVKYPQYVSAQIQEAAYVYFVVALRPFHASSDDSACWSIQSRVNAVV